MNLLIGLCFGMGAAAALAIMWRFAAKIGAEESSFGTRRPYGTTPRPVEDSEDR